MPAFVSDNLLPPADVLLVVPPVAQAPVPSLAAHLLQAYCRRDGVSVAVFYGNLHFSGLIGPELYHAVVKHQHINFIGERLFARAAFGLPVMGRNIFRLIDPGWLPDHRWRGKNGAGDQEMAEFLEPDRRWILSVDWQEVEQQALDWTEAAASAIARRGYKVVGCTNTLAGTAPPIALLNQVKKAAPHITTLLGGALCEDQMADGVAALDTGIDYIFSGDSDITFPTVVRDLLDGKQHPRRIVRGQEFVAMDRVPLPDYREYFEQLDQAPGDLPEAANFPILYESSRGCWWKKCTFCGLNGARRSYRVKSPEIVLEELARLADRHPGHMIQTTDNLIPAQYFNTLFPRIGETLPRVRMRYEVNASLTLRQVLILRRGGVTNVQPGIESLSPHLLQCMQKPTTLRQNIAFLRHADSVGGIDVHWQLHFGIPGDRADDYREMIELIRLIHHLQPPSILNGIELHRFSRYQTEPEAFGITNLRPAQLYEDVLPEGAPTEKIAYYFTGDFESGGCEAPGLLAELHREVERWQADHRRESPPVLHIEEAPQAPRIDAPRRFLLRDTRGLPGLPETQTIDRPTARLLLTASKTDTAGARRREQQQKAVRDKLGVFRESWFIPLAVASPDLLTAFENENETK